MKYILLILAVCLVFVANSSSQTGATSLPLPTVEQVLEKYVQAIGGKAAHEKLTSRVASGEWENVTRGIRHPIEVYAKAPDMRVEILHAAENPGLTARGYDGRQGWSMNMLETGLRQVKGAELSMMQRESDFYRQVRLNKLYQRLEVVAKAKVDGREVYTVEATPEIGPPEKLYFDTGTGLLMRRDVVYESPHGQTPVQQYYEDYREVDGVRLPFTIRTQGPVTIITKFKEVKHNVIIEETKFKNSDPHSS